jgi:hypothetical protein
MYHILSSNHTGYFFRFALAGIDDLIIASEAIPGESPFSNSTLTSYGGIYDVFAGRLSMFTDIAEYSGAEMSVRIFPNPVKDDLGVRIIFDIPDAQLLIRITDIQGRELMRKHIIASEHQVTFPCGQLTDGLYLLHVTDHKIHHVQRFIKGF